MLLLLTNKLGFTLFSLEICFLSDTMQDRKICIRTQSLMETTHFISHNYILVSISTLLEINYVRLAENVTRIIYDDHGCEKKAPDIVNAWPGEQPSLSLEISVCKT